LHRIYELSDRDNTQPPINGRPFIKLLPLHELIKKTLLEPGVFTKKVWNIYFDLLNKCENEYQILIELEKNELHDLKIDKNLLDLIIKNREGLLHINPGFDGRYGEILWN
jgi:PHP family Zn ribbon phosphoesterase